ncbi:hypothetical protein [Paenibacillus arenosi]|uniref:Uncharacterized protein n=1 Tax=Paenibacillus arenosi TaxID=2774142 RepID=A0ABR9B4W5_9BACL|nr:hypothetical protein [Paenibacillus arenosi]MBD8500226.1 hypothetical protein [Paenibacillus arenosi]
MINELIDRYPNPVSLVDVTEQELLNIKGIGVSKAKQIVAAVQLVQEFAAPSPEPIIIRSPSDVFSLIKFDMRYASKELLSRNTILCDSHKKFENPVFTPKKSLV